MSTNLRFPRPKDPHDQAWYQIPFAVDIATVDGLSCVESKPTSSTGAGAFSTAGDNPTGATDLVVNNATKSTDNKSVKFLATGGKPKKSYAVTAAITDVDGNKLFRSAILEVTGL